MKTAELKDRELARQIADRYERAHGVQMNGLPMNTARILRRAERTLHSWAEHECNGTIQREGDQGNGKPFYYYTDRSGAPRKGTQCADREAGALRRIEAVCKEAGLYYYHQGDPRGCALYVDVQPLPENNYTRGICCSI